MSVAAPWRSALLKSLDLNKEVKFSTFFQLATIRPNGKPANRTMVYRGFVGDSTKLTFTTDSRYTANTQWHAWLPVTYSPVSVATQLCHAVDVHAIRASHRSSKMDHVKENPWSEICWYFTESREQYRLSGKLYIIKSDEKDAELKKVSMAK